MCFRISDESIQHYVVGDEYIGRPIYHFLTADTLLDWITWLSFFTFRRGSNKASYPNVSVFYRFNNAANLVIRQSIQRIEDNRFDTRNTITFFFFKQKTAYEI